MILSGSAVLAGIMGWPISHSRSPRLHGYWLPHYGIDGAYLPMAVRPEALGRALAALPDLGFKGVNLTLPHKERALAHCAALEPSAERAGAVNTIVVGADGALTGSNTDIFGFVENLKQNSDWQGGAGSALVLGSGGAARGVLLGLWQEGVTEIRLANRTGARAEALASEFADLPITIVDWPDRDAALDGIGLLVNTTTLGMVGQPPLELALDRLPDRAIVNDIVYTPLKTALLAAAAARGNAVVDGLGMLLYQAVPGFAHWFGVTPDVTKALRDFVLEPKA